ncbi:hypothetical protein B0H15DRAFT_1024665 [Mycena belliarum]|uniref:Uncharacterized protein n=1 Tax=Mycena belliarum TaxID=1033014 RepID=A0AAD6TW62_9AGAR|nr:hypothetical protein B0H15DRAFT_1024665 [Mycena belliae]
MVKTLNFPRQLKISSAGVLPPPFSLSGEGIEHREALTSIDLDIGGDDTENEDQPGYRRRGHDIDGEEFNMWRDPQTSDDLYHLPLVASSASRLPPLVGDGGIDPNGGRDHLKCPPTARPDAAAHPLITAARALAVAADTATPTQRPTPAPQRRRPRLRRIKRPRIPHPTLAVSHSADADAPRRRCRRHPDATTDTPARPRSRTARSLWRTVAPPSRHPDATTDAPRRSAAVPPLAHQALPTSTPRLERIKRPPPPAFRTPALAAAHSTDADAPPMPAIPKQWPTPRPLPTSTPRLERIKRPPPPAFRTPALAAAHSTDADAPPMPAIPKQWPTPRPPTLMRPAAARRPDTTTDAPAVTPPLPPLAHQAPPDSRTPALADAPCRPPPSRHNDRRPDADAAGPASGASSAPDSRTPALADAPCRRPPSSRSL